MFIPHSDPQLAPQSHLATQFFTKAKHINTTSKIPFLIPGSFFGKNKETFFGEFCSSENIILPFFYFNFFSLVVSDQISTFIRLLSTRYIHHIVGY
jgi:hypothetical protein